MRACNGDDEQDVRGGKQASLIHPMGQGSTPNPNHLTP